MTIFFEQPSGAGYLAVNTISGQVVWGERCQAALPSGPAQVRNSPPKNFCQYNPAQGGTTVHAREW